MKLSVLFFFFFSISLYAQEIPLFAGCEESDFVFIDQEVVTVSFLGKGYSPRCLRVRPGTTVILPASSHHPLQGSADINGNFNPFINIDAHTNNQERVLDDLGFIGFYCIKHADSTTGVGMAGLIEVVN